METRVKFNIPAHEREIALAMMLAVWAQPQSAGAEPPQAQQPVTENVVLMPMRKGA